MYIMGRHFNKRAVNSIIAALLLIAITVAAAILLYVFSIGLLGSLGSSGGSQTKQQLIMEAYNWNVVAGPISVNLRNVGSAAVAVGAADVFLNGLSDGTLGGNCKDNLAVQASCVASVAIPAGLTPAGGVAYVLKIVTPDGAVFSYTVIAGQAS